MSVENCYSQKPEWEDISYGKDFHYVGANSESTIIWAVLRTKHSSEKGWQLAIYDEIQSLWKSDETQIVGAKKTGLAVDSDGLPAFV